MSREVVKQCLDLAYESECEVKERLKGAIPAAALSWTDPKLANIEGLIKCIKAQQKETTRLRMAIVYLLDMVEDRKEKGGE